MTQTAYPKLNAAELQLLHQLQQQICDLTSCDESEAAGAIAGGC